MIKILRTHLLTFAKELGLEILGTTTDEDAVRAVLITARNVLKQGQSVSRGLHEFVSTFDEESLAESCFGKYWDAVAPECRQCLESANCEFLSKGLTTPAYLTGSAGSIPKEFHKPKPPTPTPAQKVAASKGISPKNKAFFDWVAQTFPDAEICEKRVYYTIKKGSATVVTVESVESNKPQFEILFNRLKTPESVGGSEPHFKKKYDGWYYIGTDFNMLKAAFTKHWENS